MKTRRHLLSRTFGVPLLLLGTLVAGCSFGFAVDDDFGFSASTEDVLSILYPDLSEEEIAELSLTLDYEDALALVDELDAARKAAEEFSADLFKTSGDRVEEREEILADENGGYPEEPKAVGSICLYDEDEGSAELVLSGVFDGQTAVHLEGSQVTVRVDGEVQEGELSCLSSGQSVDIVFLIDITGSMSNVIDSVTDSVVRFVDAIEDSGVEGTISVVSFQDSVGVNTTFQEVPPDGARTSTFERSPFFAPVSISDSDAVEEARSFINRLEANQGADAPENLAGAIDFARNNVIGGTASRPNVIDGDDDPPFTEAFPELTSERQVFIALTDITFHADDRDEGNSSLQRPFVPRDAETILQSLHQTGTVVHVVDPSWVDETTNPGTDDPGVDADYWAKNTGGLGEDVVAGYSLVDLELVVVAEDAGLLDIALDGIISSTCSFTFDAELSADAEIEVEFEIDGEISTEVIGLVSF